MLAPDSTGLGVRGRKMQLSMRERCQRIVWGINTAGGWACAGAAVLAALHVGAFGVRMWGVWRGEYGGEEEDMLGEEHFASMGRGMEEWEYAPREVDVRTRAVRPHISSRTSSAAQQPTTISEEEHSTGVRVGRKNIRQRTRVETKSKSRGSEDEAPHSTGQTKWMETLLECLVP